jgi:two-component system, chemotaxis family, protein-glutamate methylesterase/glutaminase
MSKKIKVILVEDSTTFRELVKSVLEENPDIEVVSQALNGKVALPRIRHYEPDVLILDQEMPEMSGMELLKEIQGKYPNMGTIMLSAHTIQGARLTIKCLELGAWDFITKPNFTYDGDPKVYIRSKLIPRILEFYSRKEYFKNKRLQPPSTPHATDSSKTITEPEPKKYTSSVPRHIPMGFCKSVGIGISTGGPVALRELFSKLQRPLLSPIFIVQHMPPVFTKQLAESLNELTPITVVEAQDGMIPFSNTAYIAPGGRHMKLEVSEQGAKKIRITDDPPEEICKPSVNILFRSMAEVYGNKNLSVIMTGMGSDGYKGLLELRKQNAYIIGQDKESCLIYGMPERPISDKIVDEVLALNDIAERIEYLIGVAH